MKLATLPGPSRDGRLVLVSRDLTRAVGAWEIAETMQEALDSWTTVAPVLEALFADLEAGRAAGVFEFSQADALAPLPRAWQWLDGSAFESHGALMAQVFGIKAPPRGKPLMYQGMSHCFLSARANVPFPSEQDGIDFEGEFAVITDDVPMGVTAVEAAQHIKLVVQINDWSLRALAAAEMKTGFGWVHAKPACSVAPVAVTPDELGRGWHEGRVALPLRVELNGIWFGEPSGAEMGVGFPELIAHAARTRDLCPGTIIGSGTVSNHDFQQVGSTCLAERRGIETLDDGAPRTEFMRFGDRIRMEARTLQDTPLFGAIEQRVVAADARLSS